MKLVSPAAVLAVFVLDRLTKAWTLEHLFSRSITVLPFFRLTYAENTGVAFGMFHGNNLFFVAVSVVLVAALLYFRRRIRDLGLAAEAGLALVLGGALGNLYDRLAYGFVVDFFDFSFFPAVFNVADSAITAGAVLLAWGTRERNSGTGKA
ncbi:MAG: signal peptidase II [Elusimicrobia bacterium RIFOXYA2_FULL_58_8]|nr:MAG: signal peptidase II [Elusimicrobia bacterium RIFOXYA2_FULL_58_8]OGS14294.1 MAG: signal peptidase II [Elusimicrobia bacterium RIFOXYA12_FULL_57_11]